MTAQRMEWASPPDDGGHQGTYTEPQQMLLTGPEDTRSSESIGNEPFRTRDGNRGLLLFLLVVFALEALLMVAARWFS